MRKYETHWGILLLAEVFKNSDYIRIIACQEQVFIISEKMDSNLEFSVGALFLSVSHIFCVESGWLLDILLPPFHTFKLRLGLFPYFKDV